MKMLHAFHIEKLHERNDFHGGNFVAFVDSEDAKLTYVGEYGCRKRPHQDDFISFKVKGRTVGGFHSAAMHAEGHKFTYIENVDPLALHFITKHIGTQDAVDGNQLVDGEELFHFLLTEGEVFECDRGEPSRETANLEATAEPTPPAPRKMDFYVQMRGHTFDDMESMVIRAASEQVVRRSGGELKLGEKAFGMALEKVSETVEEWSSDILGITALKEGDKAYTVKDMIMHKAEQYAQEKVDLDNGEPHTGGYVSRHGRVGPRLQYLISKSLRHIFEKEIDKAVQDQVSEMRREYKSKVNQMVSEQKEKFAKAIDAMT